MMWELSGPTSFQLAFHWMEFSSAGRMKLPLWWVPLVQRKAFAFEFGPLLELKLETACVIIVVKKMNEKYYLIDLSRVVANLTHVFIKPLQTLVFKKKKNTAKIKYLILLRQNPK